MKPIVFALAAALPLAALTACETETAQATTAETRQVDPIDRAAARYSITTSTVDFDETLRRLYEAIDRRDLTVFATVDHAAGARSVEMELPPATVIFFGSPRIGTSLMDAVPILSAELPLRAAVYRDKDGTVKVATTSATALGRDYPVLREQSDKLSAISANLAALRAEAAGTDG
ncbi:MAG: DUF302 domain-containing protein [Pseudomonadota bacterium]